MSRKATEKNGVECLNLSASLKNKYFLTPNTLKFWRWHGRRVGTSMSVLWGWWAVTNKIWGDWYGQFLHQWITTRRVDFLSWWRERDAWGVWAELWGPADPTGPHNCWDWKGPKDIIQSNAFASEGLSRAGCPWLCPVEFLKSPKRFRIPNPCQCFTTHTVKKDFLC